MKRAAVVVVIVSLLVGAAMLVAPLLAQQPPAPAPGPGGPPGQGFRAPQMTPEQMQQVIDRMLDQLGQQAKLTPQELAAAKQAARAKWQARDKLQTELRALMSTVRDQNASDAQLKTALSKFRTALQNYYKSVNGMDRQLVGKLSVRGQAALTAFGILDNGLGSRFGAGMGMGMRMGGAGGGQPGGMRSQRGQQRGPRGPSGAAAPSRQTGQ